MARKQVDPTLKVADIISNNMGTTALKYRDKAPNDKSYFVTVLGINRKFIDSVPADKQNEVIEKYHISETTKEGENNYYTIQINGEYYCVQQEGSFFLYDQVMAYLPNGDWSRMYLDYPVNYTESVTFHVFTQAEEPEEGMNVNDVWFKIDENENIIALYHYGLNEDTQENEWIFDGKVESGGSGTGKWLDDAHTSVAHNDWEHNTSQGMYDSVDGYDNQLTGESAVSETGYVRNGANTVTGQHNRVQNSSALQVSGHGNTVSNSSNSVITGLDNTINNNAHCSFVGGHGTTIGNNASARYSVIVGQNTTIDDNGYVDSSFVAVDDQYISGRTFSSIYQSVVVGGAGSDAYNTIPSISYSVVVSDAATINGSVSGCIISGFNNKNNGSIYYDIISGNSNKCNTSNGDIISGYDNTVTNSNYAIVTGDENTVSGSSDCIVTGHDNTLSGAYCCIVAGTGASVTDNLKRLVIGRTGGNVFTVDTDGNVVAAGTITPGGADYAETYEWFDGNPDGEDRRGLFVTLDGKYIKLATLEDDYILGVISTTPSICGDTYDLYWKGKYRKNIFGEIEYDDDGNLIISDDYNSELKYIPQSQRKEKAKVGTHGKLVVVDDGTCQVNKYCKPSVNGVGTYTDDKNYYRVLERLDNTHIKIVIK